MFDPYKDYGLHVPYALVIDTDSYAGNFERAMRQWITGYEGEHDPGGIVYITNKAQEELGAVLDEIFDLLGYVNHDEYGRMNVIMTNKKGEEGYKSVAILFQEKPSDELLNLMVARARRFPEAQVSNAATQPWIDMKKFKPIQVLGVRFESYKVSVEMTEKVL